MKRAHWSAIALGAVLSVFPLNARAYGGYGSGFGSQGSGFGVELQYDSVQRLDLSALSTSYPLLPSLNSYLNGNFQGQRGLVNVSYKPGNFKFTATGGMSFSSNLVQSEVNGGGFSAQQTLPFDAAFTFGGGLSWDVLGDLPFHIRPMLNYLHASLSSAKGTVSNNGCTYEYGTAAPAGCRTFGNVNLAAGTTYGIQNAYSQNEFDAGLELAADLGPLTLFVGGQESLIGFSGKSTVTNTGAQAVIEVEELSLQNSNHEGVYAGLSLALGSLRVTGKYTMVSQQMITGAVSMNF